MHISYNYKSWRVHCLILNLMRQCAKHAKVGGGGGVKCIKPQKEFKVIYHLTLLHIWFCKCRAIYIRNNSNLFHNQTNCNNALIIFIHAFLWFN